MTLGKELRNTWRTSGRKSDRTLTNLRRFYITFGGGGKNPVIFLT